MTKKPTRAVGYVRISVDRDDETSTATQEERVLAYCKANGWEVVKVVPEPGRSAYKGSRTSRPGFQEVMGLVRSGAADVVVVWKLDRAARNTEDTLALVRELGEHGAQFASVTEHFDTTTASGRMMLTVLSALAEMESATKSERIQVWQDHRRTTGKTPTGPRPYGYKRGGKDKPNVLTIVKKEAKVIEAAAKAVLDKKSLRSIVGGLAAKGVVGTKGTPITQRGLRSILTSPTIAACREVTPDVFVPSDAWKPILDRGTWEAVRTVLLDPKRTTSPGGRRRWLLSGIATCASCRDDDGKPIGMRSRPHPRGPRYICPKCHVGIGAARTDEAVEADLLAVLDRPTWKRLRQGRSVGPDTSGFELAMTELTARFVAGDIDPAELAAVADELRSQQAAAPLPLALPDVPDLAAAWPDLTLEQKRLVLSTATESLTIESATVGASSFDAGRIVWQAVP